MKPLDNITINQAKEVLDADTFLDDELLLFDRFGDVPLPTDSRRMNCLFVALCLQGTAQYTVDTRQYTVHPNDVIVISDGQVVGNYDISDDCRGIAIMASNGFYQEVMKEVHELSSLFIFANSHPVFGLTPERAQTFCEYYNIIRRKVNDTGNHFRKHLVSALLKALIYEVSNEIYNQQGDGSRKTRAEAIFTRFIGLVKQHFRHERRVGWYATQLYITPKYLSETVKGISKRTPNEWIDQYVTMELRVMLRNTTKSIKEIAQEMNFPNQSFLGKYFKEHTGMSPSNYRKM